MCCIIHRLKDTKQISKENLEKIIKKNPHGWGISYINEQGIMEVEKSMDMKLVIDKIKELEDKNLEFLFHARYATHGEKNEANCHPFPIHNGVMFHNGKMEVDEWRKGMSDSWHFAMKIAKFRRKKKKLDDLITKKYKNTVGECRLAFMLKDGTIGRYGVWHDINGNLYSKIDWQAVSLIDHITNRVTKTIPHSYRKNDNIYSDEFWKNANDKNRLVNGINQKDISFSQAQVSAKELAAIEASIESGIVKDQFIEVLEVEDIALFCENYSDNMGNYLYDLIRQNLSGE